MYVIAASDGTPSSTRLLPRSWATLSTSCWDTVTRLLVNPDAPLPTSPRRTRYGVQAQVTLADPMLRRALRAGTVVVYSELPQA